MLTTSKRLCKHARAHESLSTLYLFSTKLFVTDQEYLFVSNPIHHKLLIYISKCVFMPFLNIHPTCPEKVLIISVMGFSHMTQIFFASYFFELMLFIRRFVYALLCHQEIALAFKFVNHLYGKNRFM